MRFLGPTAIIVLCSVAGPSTGLCQTFLRGDADRSFELEITDAIATLNTLFLGHGAIPCDDAADSNDSGEIDVADPLYTINFLFLGGPQPPAPYPEAGNDPTADSLACSTCTGSQERYAGPLCGTETLSCILVEDSVVDDTLAFHDGAPSLALDGSTPLVAFRSVNDGMFAQKNDAGSWVAEPMRSSPDGEIISLFNVALAVNPQTGRPLALVQRGQGAELLARESSGFWDLIDTEETARVAAFRPDLEVDATGCLYSGFLVVDGPRQPSVGVHAARWQLLPVGEPNSVQEIALELSPSGTPYLAFWEALDVGWVLRLGSPSGGVQTVVPQGSNSLEQQRDIRFAITGEGESMRAGLLVNRWEEAFDTLAQDHVEPHHVLDYVVAGPGGLREVYRVGDDDPFFESPAFCFEAPPVDGATCPVDFVSHHSIDVIANAAGETRFIYSRVRAVGQLVAECENEDPQSCGIRSEIDYQGELHLGWIVDGEVRTRMLAEGVAFERGSAVLDTDGQIHVVGFDLVDGRSRVRYQRFAADEALAGKP